MPLNLAVSGSKKASAVELTEGKIYKLVARSESFDITCLEGRLWITQENDPVDHIISGGEHFTTTKKGVILVQSCPDRDGRKDHGTLRVA